MGFLDLDSVVKLILLEDVEIKTWGFCAIIKG